MSIAFGKSDLLSHAAKGIEALSVAMNRMTEFDSELLRMAGYATVAVAALALLGFALSGVAAIAGLVASPVGLAAAAIGTLAAINLAPIASGFRSLTEGFRSTVDPKILAGLGGMKTRIGEFVAALKIPDHALDGAAGQLGRFAASLTNDASRLGPVLTDYGERLRSFGSGALAANLPAIIAGLDSFRAAIAGFVSTKIDALVGLGGSLVSFMETTLPKFTPAAADAVTLFADSFRTLGAAFQTVGQFVDAATTGLASFARSFIDAIDLAAMQSIANGVKSALDAITVPVSALGDAYASIGRSITGASGDIDAFAATAGASMARGFNAIVETLSSISSYVPNFGGIVGAVSSFVGTISGLVDRLIGEAQRMRDAIASLSSAGIGQARANNPVWLNNLVGAAPAPAAIRAIQGPPLPRKASGGLVRGGRSYLVGD